jgi:hypothetical protein
MLRFSWKESNISNILIDLIDWLLLNIRSVIIQLYSWGEQVVQHFILWFWNGTIGGNTTHSRSGIHWLLFTLSEDHSSFCFDKQQTITRYSPEPGWINNRIGGVMVILLASNAVDRGYLELIILSVYSESFQDYSNSVIFRSIIIELW